MRILVMGLGNIGRELAIRLRADGHHVIGTTTTPEKVEALSEYVDEVAVLFGHEADKVATAGKDCDAVVVTVAPDARKSRTPEEREAQYRQVLVDSCESAAGATPRVIFASSFSVYGDGGTGDGDITEETPCSNNEEPSSKYYQLAEQAVLQGNEGCVLRFPDMYGAEGDMSYPQRVQMCHDYMGGNAIFSADALLYSIHYLDVVDAILHALQHNLTGIYNVCDETHTPHTNREVFDAICRQEGMPMLNFLDQILAPTRRISAAKIYATGYRVQHQDPNAAVVQADQASS